MAGAAEREQRLLGGSAPGREDDPQSQQTGRGRAFNRQPRAAKALDVEPRAAADDGQIADTSELVRGQRRAEVDAVRPTSEEAVDVVLRADERGPGGGTRGRSQQALLHKTR